MKVGASSLPPTARAELLASIHMHLPSANIFYLHNVVWGLARMRVSVHEMKSVCCSSTAAPAPPAGLSGVSSASGKNSEALHPSSTYFSVGGVSTSADTSTGVVEASRVVKRQSADIQSPESLDAALLDKIVSSLHTFLPDQVRTCVYAYVRTVLLLCARVYLCVYVCVIYCNFLQALFSSDPSTNPLSNLF